LRHAVGGPFGVLKGRLPLQIRLGNWFRPSGGGGGSGDSRALLWRELFHAGLAAGFSTLAADRRQVFRYRSALPKHLIDSKASSRKFQPPVDNAEAESAYLRIVLLKRIQQYVNRKFSREVAPGE
jgi:hypothetical protein